MLTHFVLFCLISAANLIDLNMEMCIIIISDQLCNFIDIYCQTLTSKP